MDLQTERFTYDQEDTRWLVNWNMVVGNNLGGTMLTKDLVLGRHFTADNTFLMPGFFVARYVGGADDGFLGPYTPGATNGLQTIEGAVYSDFFIKTSSLGVPLADRITGAIVLPGTNAQVQRKYMPNYWTSGGVDTPVTSADLPAAWVDLDSVAA